MGYFNNGLSPTEKRQRLLSCVVTDEGSFNYMPSETILIISLTTQLAEDARKGWTPLDAFRAFAALFDFNLEKIWFVYMYNCLIKFRLLITKSGYSELLIANYTFDV